MRISDTLHSWIERATRPRQGNQGPPDDGFRCLVCAAPTTRFRVFGDQPWIARCTECETETLRPLPTAEDLRTYYHEYQTTRADDALLSSLVELNELALRHALHSVGRRPADLKAASYLEVGFGNAAGLIAAARLGAKASGVDLDPAGVKRASSYAERLGVALRVLCGEVTEFRKGGDRFDFVRASHVIEHTLDPRCFLHELSLLQPPGGLLLVECPNNKALFWLLKNVLRTRMHRENFYNSLKLQEHLWGFTRQSLMRLVESEGYRVLSCRDYALGDARYQPETTVWYPGWGSALRTLLSGRGLIGCQYAAVRSLDSVASKLLAGGTGLALVASRMGEDPAH